MIMLFFWLIKGIIWVTGKCGLSICFVREEVCISSHLQGSRSGALSPGRGCLRSPGLDLLLQPEVRDLWIMVEHQHE